MPSQREPRIFKEAFARVLLDRTGVAVTSVPLREEQLKRELELALRLDGFAGDAVAGGDAGEGGEVQWSEEAPELMRMAARLGPTNPNLSSEAFVKPFFKHLRLPDLGLKALDEDIAKFTNLTFLDVSRNDLSAIDCLPPNLRFLKAYNTNISRISCKPLESLCFLGLGHSFMGGPGLKQAARLFPGMLSLDLSYSQMSALDEVVNPLQPLSKLRQLCFIGSPVVLLPYYRLKLLHWLPQLKLLDGVAAGDEELADAEALARTLPLSPPAAAPTPKMLLAIRLARIDGLRVLLAAEAERHLVLKRQAAEALAARQAAEREAQEADDASPKAAAAAPPAAEGEGEQPDAVYEACRGAALVLHFQLPSGDWVEARPAPLEPETDAPPATPAAAAAAPAAATPDDGAEAFDVVDLAKVGAAAGGALSYEIGLNQESLGKLCRWLRQGMAVRASLRHAVPEEEPPPDDADADGSPANASASAASRGTGAASPTLSDLPEGEEQVAAEKSEVKQVEDVPIGGSVVALDEFLHHVGTMVTEDMRRERLLQETPAPWRYEIKGARVVPVERWLEPEVQVPQADPALRPDGKPGVWRHEVASDAAAVLQLEVSLYASAPEDEAPQEEAAEEPPTPAASPKKK